MQNKVIISTRPAGQNVELIRLLETQGAKLIEMPTIEIKSASLQIDDEERLIRINQFSWIVFTSPNGVHYFFQNLKKFTGSYDLPDSIKTAVVGKKTRTILAQYGYEATMQNPGNTGKELAAELIHAVNDEDDILFPEGDLARETIADILSTKATCTKMVVYHNSIPQNIKQDDLNRIVKNQYDYIILTSPSCFVNLEIALNNKVNVKQLRFICIGTTTAEEIESQGIEAEGIANVSSASGIVEAISRAIQKEKTTKN